MKDKVATIFDLGERMKVLENRVEELEMNLMTLQHQQNQFYDRTSSSIHDLQKSMHNVQDDIHTLMLHNRDMVPVVQKLGLWLQQGGYIGKEIKE